ncbi:ATP-binding cassette domain-containing protein [Nioella sp.]|uniref:ATP-binding cassette domain-containing protein n=1 Tax=Nioella sp. TaxID=1912091 RepID=UPI003B53005F
MRRFIIVFLLTVIPSSLFAQQRGHLVEYLGASGQGRSSMIMILSQNMFALNPGHDGALVADLNFGTIRVWDARGGRFVDLQAAMQMAGAAATIGAAGDTSALDEARATVAELIPDMLDGVDPNQREAVQAALEGAIGLTGTPSPSGQTLSGGQQQRVAISRSLLMDAELILLDEPTSAYQGSDTELARLIAQDGQVLRDYVLAPQEALPGVEEVLEILRRLQSLHVEITGDPIPPEAILPDLITLEPHGFPVRIDDHLQQERWDLARLELVNYHFDRNGMPVVEE